MIQHERAVKFDFYTGCGGAGRAEHGRRVFGAVARRAGRHRAPRRERARARRRHARRPPARGARPAVPRARALPSRHGRRPARRPAAWKSTSASGAPENSSLSHVSAMTRPCWLRRTVRNPLCHAVEQALRRWRGGRRDDSARTRRKLLISTQAPSTRRRSPAPTAVRASSPTSRARTRRRGIGARSTTAAPSCASTSTSERRRRRDASTSTSERRRRRDASTACRGT